MKKTPDLYIGEQLIKSIDGNKVVFQDGTEKEYTTRQLEYMVTKEPKDLTAQRDLLISNIIPDILKVLTEHDVRKADMKYIYENVFTSYNELFFKAIGKAFGTYKEGLHSAYFEENIRISDISRVATK